MNLKDVLIRARDILGIYMLYVALFGLILFGIYKKPISKEYLNKHSIHRFFGQAVSQDRVALIEDRYYSGLTRVNLIEGAEKTLDISYYTIHEGVSTDIFLGSILEAADRGVEVRLVLDGIFHHLEDNLRDVIYAFTNHPNIELKFYEPFNLLKPWTWNNRLHDKFIIVDNKKAIIGGRNIGDKYFAQDHMDIEVVNDRDVLILNMGEESSDSVILQLKDYFNSVWGHDYSLYPRAGLTNRQREKGDIKLGEIRDRMLAIREESPEIFGNNFDCKANTYPTKNITLIHNPLERIKEPWVYHELTSLARAAEDSIFIQSPYIIPSRAMVKILDPASIEVKDIDILTNSLYSSPNPFAIAGYMNHRKDIVANSRNLYEYQGDGSIHAKTYIFDKRISAIGSFNFDARSAYLSTETMVIIDSEEFAAHLKDEITNYTDQSLLVDGDYSYIENPRVKEGQASLFKKLIIRAFSIIVYCFDFML